jgi:RNA polymerase sigma factor (sigma-70 family)
MGLRCMAVAQLRHVEARLSAEARRPPRSQDWHQRSETWGFLMTAAQKGDHAAYTRLLRELDSWLRRYYGRRLPHPASQDARQEALLAVHARRSAYDPARSFGAWVVAIARHKWVDGIRAAARSEALSRRAAVPVEDNWEDATSIIAVDELLRRLTPAQARAIRLVKLEGASIATAANLSGQSPSLVKVNIHRGLKRLASFVAHEAAASGVQSREKSIADHARPVLTGPVPPVHGETEWVVDGDRAALASD